MNELRMIKKLNQDAVLLSIDGEIDIFNIGKVREQLVQLTDGFKEVQIDMKNLNFIDSTGLGMLIGLVRDLKGKNGSVVLINPRPQVMRLLETTGLNTVFEVRRGDESIA